MSTAPTPRARNGQRRQQAGSGPKKTHIIPLPAHYPAILKTYNTWFGEIKQIATVSNFLGISPFWLCFDACLVFCILAFARFLVNVIVVTLLFTTTLYECFFLTAIAEEVIFSQILSITVFLTCFACYLLVSPFLDFCLDWVPFYHAAKLVIAFSITHKTDITKTGVDLQQLLVVDDNDEQDGEYNEDDEEYDDLLLVSTKKAKHVPALPPTIKLLLDMIYTINLLIKAYAKRTFRSTIWNIRTWAFDVYTKYTAEIDDNDLDEFVMLLQQEKQQQQQALQEQKNNNTNNNNNSNNNESLSKPKIDDDELDDILDEYVQDFGDVDFPRSTQLSSEMLNTSQDQHPNQ